MINLRLNETTLNFAYKDVKKKYKKKGGFSLPLPPHSFFITDSLKKYNHVMIEFCFF